MIFRGKVLGCEGVVDAENGLQAKAKHWQCILFDRPVYERVACNKKS